MLIGGACGCRARDVAACAAPMSFHRVAPRRCHSNEHLWGFAGFATPMLFHRAFEGPADAAARVVAARAATTSRFRPAFLRILESPAFFFFFHGPHKRESPRRVPPCRHAIRVIQNKNVRPPDRVRHAAGKKNASVKSNGSQVLAHKSFWAAPTNPAGT